MNTNINNLKIVFVGDYNSAEILTGPEKVAKRVFTNLDSKTDSVFVEYFSDGSKYNIWQKLFGKTEVQTENEGKVLKLGVFSIIGFTLKFKPQIIHIISYQRFSLIFFLLKIFMHYKISYTIHGIIVYENKKFRSNLKKSLIIKDKIAERFIFKYSDKLFFLSDQSLNIAKRYYKISCNKITFISNGIDEVFHTAFLNRKYSLKEKLNIVLIADTSRPEKGLNFFLESINPIQDQFNINILGETELLKYSAIKFIPKMETNKLAIFLKDQDVFISSSSNDTFNIAVVEAMAAGVVPVITYETGISKSIMDKQNGFVYSYGDNKKLLNILLSLKDNYGLIKSISQNASRIFNELNWKLISEEYLKIFGVIINEE